MGHPELMKIVIIKKCLKLVRIYSIVVYLFAVPDEDLVAVRDAPICEGGVVEFRDTLIEVEASWENLGCVEGQIYWNHLPTKLE